MLANPPFGVEWKQQQKFIEDEHRLLGYQGRFGAGLPRIDNGALLFLQNMLSKMRTPQDGGSRIAIVFNGSPLFTGDAGGGESNIRQWIIENDWLEAIVALPDQLFYNTGISTYIWLLTNRKEAHRKGKIQLVDAREFFVKMKKSLGNKRNKLGDTDEGEPDQIGEIARIHGNFHDGEARDFTVDGREKSLVVNKVFDNEDFGYRKITVERPLRLNFQASAERIARLDEQTGFKNLAGSNKKDEATRQREIEAGRQRQQQIRALVQALAKADGERLYRDREDFVAALRGIDRRRGVRLSAGELKAVLGALGERDETAEICRDRNGKPEPDSELRNTETVPLKEDVEAYFRREVLPHLPDAWIDHGKTKIGYQIPFIRHFYRYEPLRLLVEIDAEIKNLEEAILSLLREVGADQRAAALNPTTKLYASEVEWIGEVPTHWECRRLQDIVKLTNGYPFDSEFFDRDEGIPLVRIRDLFSETTEVSWTGTPVTEAEINDHDILIGMDGDFNIAWWSGGPALLNQRVCCLRAKAKISDQRFLYYCLPFPLKALNDITYSTTVKHLSSNDVLKFRLLLPSVDEQHEIGKYIDRETAKIDRLTSKMEEAIERLREYRNSLITAAVTGKIDVKEAPLDVPADQLLR